MMKKKSPWKQVFPYLKKIHHRKEERTNSQFTTSLTFLKDYLKRLIACLDPLNALCTACIAVIIACLVFTQERPCFLFMSGNVDVNLDHTALLFSSTFSLIPWYMAIFLTKYNPSRTSAISSFLSAPCTGLISMPVVHKLCADTE